MKIKVTASPDRMGNITVTPVSLRHCAKYAAHMKGMTGSADSSVFIQEGGPAEEFLEELRPAKRRDIEAGWDVTFLVDPWIFGHWLGWSAEEVDLW